MNYTSIEQSIKLVELELNTETADMCYSTFGIEVHPLHLTLKNKEKLTPCWSLGALLELLREYNDCIKLDIFSNRSQKWQITISYYDIVWKEHEEINISLLEASYNTIIWLLENRYIKTEKK